MSSRDKDMSDNRFKIYFKEEERSVYVTPETTVLEGARLSDIPLIADCGGVGLCGKCRVRILDGKVDRSDSHHLTDEELATGYVLACTAHPLSDIIVSIPKSSISQGICRGLTGTESVSLKELPYEKGPLVEKYYLELSPPDTDDNTNDLDRLYNALRERTGIRNFSINIKALWKLPDLLRQARWQVTAAVDYSQNPPSIMAVEMFDTSADNFGIVLDIGTTTVEGFLVDISTGQIRHYSSHLNPQSKYGTDIISRLKFASRENGLPVLNDIIMDKINEILMELIIEGGISKDQVYSVVVSANTVMIHFFLGLDTNSILKHPQTPAALVFPTYRAGELNLYSHADAPVYITPGIGTYVGGDLISSLIYTGMPDEDFLLADIGTNGEVALVSEGAVICAATSAGPAFEGGGVKWGMRATGGAINSFYYSDTHKDFSISTIDNSQPRGICGTGLIDVLSTLLKTGFIDKKGKFRGRRKTSRIRTVSGIEEFVLAFSGNDEEAISVTEQDIGYLIKSKGAVFAGIQFLLKRFGKKQEEVGKFYIAGALGGLLNIENGITIGLFPDIERNRFVFLGNGSLHGGRILLLSKDARNKASEIASSAAYSDLSNESDYMNSYSSSLFLPHTDLNLFPSVMDHLQKLKH